MVYYKSADSKNTAVPAGVTTVIYTHTFDTDQILNFYARITAQSLSVRGAVDIRVLYNDSLIHEYTLNNIVSWDADVTTTIHLFQQFSVGTTIKITAYTYNVSAEKILSVVAYSNY